LIRGVNEEDEGASHQQNPWPHNAQNSPSVGAQGMQGRLFSGFFRPFKVDGKRNVKIKVVVYF
jgi:hypothetical protein